jgi:hypothetical protein
MFLLFSNAVLQLSRLRCYDSFKSSCFNKLNFLLNYKILIMKKLLISTLFACATLFVSCKKEIAETPSPDVMAYDLLCSSAKAGQTFYGPALQLGHGVGRAWAKLDADGTPIAIGLNLSAEAMLHQGVEEEVYVFGLPRKASLIPFDHIELGWNPHGHEPAGIYNVPHFDAHFYMISKELQASILPLAPPSIFDVAPLPAYMPILYVQTPGLVPNMGAHWVDVLSSEFQPGGTFTKTFIIGSYSGHVSFYEPMFTKSYLESIVGTGGASTAIRQPKLFERAGYYPTSYTIGYNTHPNEFIISLDNLTYHTAN